LAAAEAAGPDEPAAEVQQHPEDAFDRVVDAAVQTPGERL
jgi:hypothetical protein